MIKLRDDAGVTAGVTDIVDNPKKFKFVELDAAQLPRSFPDVDAAAVNNNYTVQAGLDPVRDSIIKETNDGPWVNIIAVREEDTDLTRIISAYRTRMLFPLRRGRTSRIAAASARQKSTSKPLHSPFASFSENPIKPSLTPQTSVPRSFTAWSVCACAAPSVPATAQASATAAAIMSAVRNQV